MPEAGDFQSIARICAVAARWAGRAFRWTLAGAAALLVAWAFWRVGTREWQRTGAGDGRTVLTVLHWSGEGGPEEDEIVERSLRDFEAANPGLRVRRINPGDYEGEWAIVRATMKSRNSRISAYR